MNIYNPALNIVRAKGYKILLDPDPRENVYGDYRAIKDGRDFIASDPLRLLALITLWANRGDHGFSRENDADIEVQVVDLAYPDDAYAEIDDLAFEAIAGDLGVFFEAIGVDVERPLTKASVSQFFGERGGSEDDVP